MKRCNQLMVDDGRGIGELCQCEFKTLQLEFIASDVVLQNSTLLTAGFHLVNLLLRKCDILTHHFYLIA